MLKVPSWKVGDVSSSFFTGWGSSAYLVPEEAHWWKQRISMIPLKHKPKPLHPHYSCCLGISFVLTELGSLASKSSDDFYMQYPLFLQSVDMVPHLWLSPCPNWSLTYNTDLLQHPYMPTKLSVRRVGVLEK